MATHVVVQGECVSSIAHQTGFLWSTLWSLPENAQLRSLRGDPNALMPGDLLYIPEKRPGVYQCATDQLHCFVRLGEPCRLMLRLHRVDGTARSALPYSLLVNGQTVQNGETGSDGEVQVSIPPGASSATLLLRNKAGYIERIGLNLGKLDPHTEISGVQARLVNLGYLRGPIDGIMGPLTRSALRSYQKAMGLEETGEANDETCRTLRTSHGS